MEEGFYDSHDFIIHSENNRELKKLQPRGILLISKYEYTPIYD